MEMRPRRTRQIESHEQSEKKELAVRAAIRRSQALLNSSPDAPRVVKQGVGGKLRPNR